MKQNCIIFTPYCSRDSHMEFTGKNKVGNTTWSKIMWLDWSKTTKQFPVNSHGKFLCQYQVGRQAGKQALSLEPSLLRILDTFRLLSCYFSEIYCTFCFRQVFNGFSTINFDFYWSLALQFACIMVRFSEDRFLFAVASNHPHKKANRDQPRINQEK